MNSRIKKLSDLLIFHECVHRWMAYMAISDSFGEEK